jgi:hypothetical protein
MQEDDPMQDDRGIVNKMRPKSIRDKDCRNDPDAAIFLKTIFRALHHVVSLKTPDLRYVKGFAAFIIFALGHMITFMKCKRMMFPMRRGDYYRVRHVCQP